MSYFGPWADIVCMYICVYEKKNKKKKQKKNKKI